MAKNVQYTGRLGLEGRDSGTMSAAVTTVVDTLDDFGHPAEQIEARAENTARLQCDHYQVTVRVRRLPLHRASKLPSSVMQPSAMLELSLTPTYPGYCDQEISELILADMLRRLVDEVEATSVEWLDTGVTLTCEQFLSAFDSQPADAAQPVALEDNTENAAAPVWAVQPRPRGRECFTPVEQTALALDAHCDLAFQQAEQTKPDSSGARETGNSWTGVLASVPAAELRGNWGRMLQASALAALPFSGPRRLRFITHLLLLTALVLYLESAGMVLAARSLVP